MAYVALSFLQSFLCTKWSILIVLIRASRDIIPCTCWNTLQKCAFPVSMDFLRRLIGSVKGRQRLSKDFPMKELINPNMIRKVFDKYTHTHNFQSQFAQGNHFLTHNIYFPRMTNSTDKVMFLCHQVYH